MEKIRTIDGGKILLKAFPEASKMTKEEVIAMLQKWEKVE